MHRWQIVQSIAEQGIIGIVRTADADAARHASATLVAGGLHAVEVSLTTPGAIEVVRDLAVAHPHAIIGVGTVLDAATALSAIHAGARLIVSPHFDPEVVRVAHRHGTVVVPGAATPGEAVDAYSAGADLVKLFPASAYGPAAFRDLHRALPQIPFVPTGGVDAEQVDEWLASGAVAVGLGSALTAGTPQDVAERLTRLLQSRRSTS